MDKERLIAKIEQIMSIAHEMCAELQRELDAYDEEVMHNELRGISKETSTKYKYSNIVTNPELDKVGVGQEERIREAHTKWCTCRGEYTNDHNIIMRDDIKGGVPEHILHPDRVQGEWKAYDKNDFLPKRD